MTLNASRSSSGRRVQKAEQPCVVSSHLCGLTTSESARSIPSNAQRCSGQTIAAPAYAASTCNQTPCCSHASAIGATGSTEVDDVVPTVATTAHASVRSSASGRSRNASSAGVFRTSSPRSLHALSTDECACSEQTTTGRRAVRGAPPRARRWSRSRRRPLSGRASRQGGRAARRATRASPPRAPGAQATSARGSRRCSALPREARRGSPAPRRTSRSTRRTAGSASASALAAARRRGRAAGSRTARPRSGGCAGSRARISPGSTCASTGSSRTRSR